MDNSINSIFGGTAISAEAARALANDPVPDDVSPAVRQRVVETILRASAGLTLDSQATLLAIAYVESGFNPAAKSKSTTASGVFQLIEKTAASYGLDSKSILDLDKNVAAGLALFKENSSIVKNRYPQLSGGERALMLYALHHDGPSLSSGGILLGRTKFLPVFQDFLSRLQRGRTIA